MLKYRIKEIITALKSQGLKAKQTDMAKAANVPQSYISKIVNNQAKAIDPQILFAIAKYLTKVSHQNFTISDLFYGEDSTPGQLPPARQPALSRKQDPLAQGETMRLEHAVPVDDDDFVAVPILGDIPCGTLDQVDPGDVVGYEYMHKDTLGPGEFFLRARGMSMAPRIEDGDLLLIQPGNNWNNGTTVIAYVEGEVTCKKLYLRNGHALLAPTNPNYNHIIVTEEMTIIGKVTKIVKEA